MNGWTAIIKGAVREVMEAYQKDNKTELVCKLTALILFIFADYTDTIHPIEYKERTMFKVSKRGQVVTSVPQLTEVMCVERNTIKRCLKKLAKDGIIHLKSNAGLLVISIEEFDDKVMPMENKIKYATGNSVRATREPQGLYETKEQAVDAISKEETLDTTNQTNTPKEPETPTLTEPEIPEEETLTEAFPFMEGYEEKSERQSVRKKELKVEERPSIEKKPERVDELNVKLTPEIEKKYLAMLPKKDRPLFASVGPAWDEYEQWLRDRGYKDDAVERAKNANQKAMKDYIRKKWAGRMCWEERII